MTEVAKDISNTAKILILEDLIEISTESVYELAGIIYNEKP